MHHTKDMHRFWQRSPLGCGSHIIQGKITLTSLTNQSKMIVTVDIARFMRKACLMSGREVDMDGDNINNICKTLTKRFI